MNPHSSLQIWATLGALLALFACSSTGDGAPPSTSADAGEVTTDAGSEASPEDAGGEAGELPTPPPYDFRVSCSASPCVTQIAARGGAHACAVLQDGSVRCWGSNAAGQLGTGETDTSHAATPHTVLGVSGASRLAATGEGTSGTTCVVTGGGAVLCFGSDVWGQLGRPAGGSSPSNPTALAVDGLSAKSVTLTNTFALAVGLDDRLWSWGANDALQLARTSQDAGDGTAAARADRVASSVHACAGTSKTGFVVADDGSLLSWGGGTAEQLGRATSLARDPLPTAIALADVSGVASGSEHACALGRGRVRCWGENERGQLGTGRKAAEWFPALVALPETVYAVAVAAGAENSCAIVSGGDVYCWGANESGQLGTSAGTDQATPVRIDGLGEQTVGVAVMGAAICALLRGGSVACWGDNLVGQLGRGSRDAELHPQAGPVVFQ